MTNNIQTENLLRVGTLLANGKYRIDKYLASGGFGNTYVATDTSFDVKVAVKELFLKGVCGRLANSADISISLTDNKRAFAAHQEKFRKEARRLRKLSNPHIVSVHDLFDENGTSYYVMDFIEGESLSARLKRTRQPMSEAELLHIVPQVLDALECVHKEGIWHLDLKPANIMVDTKGNVQLIDFGASKQFKNASGDSLPTSSALAYTQGFAPTEQTEQKFDKFGPWTDLYALGATMYSLLTMRQPPSTSDIDDDPEEALRMPSSVSTTTRQLVVWLMKPKRQERPQCVADVRQFLLGSGGGSVSVDGPDVDIWPGGDTIPFEPGSSTGPDGSKGPKPTRNWLVKAAIALVGISVCIVLFNVLRHSDNDPELPVDTVADISVPYVTDRVVSVSTGAPNMRRYIYSGEWPLSDTLPNGLGTARFAKYGNMPGGTYKGRFVNGLSHDDSGDATLSFESGDQYVGTFKDGFYDTGRYVLADKSYFEGSFKDGKPYNGAWYSSNGTLDGKVVNGRDQ